MQIKIVNNTVLLKPERHADRVTLYHLLNCSDLTQFTEYLEYAESMDGDMNMTTDLGAGSREISMVMDEGLEETEENDLEAAREIGFR